MPDAADNRTLTPRALLVGAALVLVWLAYDCTLAIFPPTGVIELLYLIGFGALFTLFVVTFFNRLLREDRRLRPGELTLIYTMVAVCIPWGILIRSALESPLKMLLLYRTTAGDDCLAWMKPPWCVGSTEAVEAFRRGGLSVSQIAWGEWLTPMLYWAAVLIAFQSFAMFLVLLLRRSFVEEERLPFPMGAVGQTLIEYTPKTDTAPARNLARAAAVAFALGLLLCLPGIRAAGPDGGGALPINIGYYGTAVGIFRGLFIQLSWDPFVLCILMFFSVDILLTVVACHVLLRIVAPIVLAWMGISLERMGDIGGEGFTFHVFGVGGLAGLAFWSLWFNRATLASTVREAFKGGRGDNPVSNRAVLLGLVISFAAFAALFVYGLGDLGTGAMVLRQSLSIVLVLAVLVGMLVALLRQNGEEAWHHWSPWSAGKVIAYPHLYYFSKLGPPLWHTQASFLQITGAIQFGALHNVFAPHLHLSDSLKVAHGVGADVRGILKAVAVVMLVAVPVVMVGYVALIHHYGFARGETANADAYFTWSQPAIRMGWEAVPTVFNQYQPWYYVPIGMALVGLVMYLRRERVGFPFSPVGIVLAAAGSGGGIGTGEIWFPMLLVLLAKTVIYRWFGVGFFRRSVMPVAVMAAMGIMTGMFLYKLLYLSLGRGLLGAH